MPSRDVLRSFIYGVSVCAFWSGTLAAIAADENPSDWPQWRGPNRTGISREQGLLKSWPKPGPSLAWKATGVGGGYSTPSVAAGRVFGMGYRGDNEIVWALDAKSGKELWATRIAKANRGVGYGEGSRSSPTVDGKQLYVLGVSGDLVCLDTTDGKEVWHRNLVGDFGGNIPGWGYSESPLVDGDQVIATPGGRNATLLALAKKTGEVSWKSQVPQGDSAHYSSAIAAEVSGWRQYIQFMQGGVVGVAAKDGTFLWRYDRPANGTANCSTPICADNHVFAASGYGTGGGLVKLTNRGDVVSANEVYFTNQMKNHHGGMILFGEHLYGFDEAVLTCMRFTTGKVVWENRSVGKGSIVLADGHLYARSEGGPVALIEATPNGYVEKGRFNQPNRSGQNAWPHPVVAGGRLYLRDQDLLLCYDVKGSGTQAKNVKAR